MFFEKLLMYMNNDSISERNRIKDSIIRDFSEYAERYWQLHKKYNSILWLNYNHVITEVELQDEKIVITTSDHNKYEMPISFFFDFHEIDLIKKLINEDIERTKHEIQRQHYIIKSAYNMIDEKNQRIKEYEKTLKLITKTQWAS